MKISMIAAVADNGAIGYQGGIPWHLPEDFKHFKKTTMGCPMIMGSKTFDSLPGILPGRLHVVISRKPKKLVKSPYVVYVSNIYEAINVSGSSLFGTGSDHIFIIGGSQIYTLAMPLATEIIITEVHMNPLGDTYFPQINNHDWKEVDRVQNTDTGIPHDIVTYRRV